MEKDLIIRIEDIENAPQKQLEVNFEDFIKDVSSTEPIKACLKISSLGEYIQITGKIEGSATLTCDLCLEDFEYKIDIELDEMYAKRALQETYGDEIELKSGQFITDLLNNNSIDILDFLYQSVILDFPNKKVCGINCKGGDIFIRDEGEPQKEIDPRLAIFKDIIVKNGK